MFASAGHYRTFSCCQKSPCLHSAGEGVVEGGRGATERNATMVRVLPQLEGPRGPAPAK
jgi:hypothetical protein